MDATGLDDPHEICPYDSAHSILRSRMQFHLVRCRQNHRTDKSQMKKCPYDTTHIIETAKYEAHIKNCPKSGSVLSFLHSTEGQRSVESVSLDETINTYVPVSSENWENEPPMPTYDPLKESEGRSFLRLKVGLSKAKKQQFRESERLRIEALGEKNIVLNPGPEQVLVPEEIDKPLHLVKKSSKLMYVSLEKDLNESLNTKSLRLPRSKSKAVSIVEYTKESLSNCFNSLMQL